MLPSGPGEHMQESRRATKKECPLCGEMMRLHEYDRVDTIPGTAETKKRKVCEWVCPECDNFEDIDQDGQD